MTRKRLVPQRACLNQDWPFPARTALAECMDSARSAEMRAKAYLEQSKGEQDEAASAACRAMHRFYASMHEFFLEERRAMTALLADEAREREEAEVATT